MPDLSSILIGVIVFITCIALVGQQVKEWKRASKPKRVRRFIK